MKIYLISPIAEHMTITREYSDTVVSTLQIFIEGALEEQGISGRKASLDVVGHDGLIRDIRAGRLPSLDKLSALFDYLGLELYTGVPRDSPAARIPELDGQQFDTVARHDAETSAGNGHIKESLKNLAH